MAALTDEDRQRLREMCEKDWVEAALGRDWNASMALCTDDFVYMPQDHPVLHGKDAAKDFLDGFPTIVSFTQRLDAVTGDSDLALLRVSFDLTIEDEGKQVSGTGKGLAAATRSSGEWLFSAVCFNWDAPLA